MTRQAMPRLLALHQITAMQASPLDLVTMASEVGCQQVCIFTHVPDATRATSPFPVVTARMKHDMLGRLREHHISVGNIEFFPVAAGVAVARYRAALALGAELGARRAVTHIHDLNEARAVQTLGELADLATEFGLTLGLEFMGLTPACNSIKRAAWFIEQLARPNAGIAVDALHLVRTGGTPADVAALPAHCYAYAQICDGRGLQVSANYLPEARDRLMPGQGDFPLKALIEALPQATPLDVEVPSSRLAQEEISALAHARQAVTRTRALIESARVCR